MIQRVKDFYHTNKKWPGIKKVLCYFWDPEPETVADGQKVVESDGTSTGQPSGSESPVSTDSEAEEDKETDGLTPVSGVSSDVEGEEESFDYHMGGKIRKLHTEVAGDGRRTELDLISPFAVCGGFRVGSLREKFMSMASRRFFNFNLI